MTITNSATHKILTISKLCILLFLKEYVFLKRICIDDNCGHGGGDDDCCCDSDDGSFHSDLLFIKVLSTLQYLYM